MDVEDEEEADVYCHRASVSVDELEMSDLPRERSGVGVKVGCSAQRGWD